MSIPSKSSNPLRRPRARQKQKGSRFEFPWHDFSLWSVSLCFSYSATFSFSLILLEMIPYCVATLIFAEIVVNRSKRSKYNHVSWTGSPFFISMPCFRPFPHANVIFFCCIRLITKDRMFGRCSIVRKKRCSSRRHSTLSNSSEFLRERGQQSSRHYLYGVCFHENSSGSR